MSGPYAVLQSAQSGASGPNIYQNKKLGWFDRWFMSKSLDAWENFRTSLVYSNKSFDANNGLNMSVYPADGGHIVQFNHYDHKIDRNFQSLHIIAHGEDFAERISQIITLELIKGGNSR
jgi:hypothetical protein